MMFYNKKTINTCFLFCRDNPMAFRKVLELELHSGIAIDSSIYTVNLLSGVDRCLESDTSVFAPVPEACLQMFLVCFECGGNTVYNIAHKITLCHSNYLKRKNTRKIDQLIKDASVTGIVCKFVIEVVREASNHRNGNVTVGIAGSCVCRGQTLPRSKFGQKGAAACKCFHEGEHMCIDDRSSYLDCLGAVFGCVLVTLDFCR